MIGDEDDPRIVGHDYTNGNPEGGRKAMENLLQINPDINVIHTINEPAAAGAYEALKAVGKEKDVLIMSVDGGCPGVKDVLPKASSAAPRSSIRCSWPRWALRPSRNSPTPARSRRRHRRQELLRHRRHVDHR